MSSRFARFLKRLNRVLKSRPGTRHTGHLMGAMHALDLIPGVLEQDDQAKARWVHVLLELQAKRETLPKGLSLLDPWVVFFEDLDKLGKSLESAPKLMQERFALQGVKLVVRGYMMLMFERDSRNQESFLQSPTSSRRRFGNSEELADAVTTTLRKRWGGRDS
jgi:hypothetical protein